VSPDDEGAAFGVLFLHNEGYSTMCGHAVIALGKAAVELGWVPADEPLTRFRIDTPAGRLSVEVEVAAGKAISTRFENVPSFVYGPRSHVEIEGLGQVEYDLAFGGAYYAYVVAADVGLVLEPHRTDDIIALGRRIKSAVAASRSIVHPGPPDLGFLYGVIFTSPATDGQSRHACVFADGALDRSPTGTGVAGRLALLHAAGEVAIGEPVAFESLTTDRFIGEIAGVCSVGSLTAVRPLIGGQAFFTGRSELVLEAGDRVGEGFLFR
jgi:trans-L-3-hydroxyproline dehydratase